MVEDHQLISDEQIQFGFRAEETTHWVPNWDARPDIQERLLRAREHEQRHAEMSAESFRRHLRSDPPDWMTPENRVRLWNETTKMSGLLQEYGPAPDWGAGV